MRKDELTPQQIEACHVWLTRKAAGMKADDVAKAIGVDRRTLYRWRCSPAWRRYESEQAVINAKSYLGDVLDVLVEKALTGHPKALELYLKVCHVIGNDAPKIQEAPAGDDRSNEAIQGEIDELLRLVEQTKDGWKHKEDDVA